MSLAAVTVTLQQLKEGLSPSTLDDAFGPDSMGIIIVSDIDPRFPALREKVFRAISALAHLSPDQLAKLELPESTWLTGWSRGREILSSSGLPDFNKGSYYVNCAFHQDSTLEGPDRKMVESFAEFKSYTTPNVWPKNVEGLETFEQDTKELCSLIIEVAEKVARNCDTMLSTLDLGRKHTMEKMISTSMCTKARLLHYYAKKGNEPVEDDWCGEHVDHSCITGLTSAQYRDERHGTTLENPDSNAGLFIRDRHNNITKVDIPADCLAFQTGSALEEMSRGKFKSVPHLVRGTNMEGITRTTLAVFCQPDLLEMVNDTENFAQFAKRIVDSNHRGRPTTTE